MPVMIDPGQLEQVLVNLVVNARDAMPNGGRLLIEVDRVELDREYCSTHPGTEPGHYARLKVGDSGTGMDDETLERIFEPFFTTKESGTGLGLATTYGIVTEAGGRIDVYSEVGLGTTFKIHLPICPGEGQGTESEPVVASERRGEGTVLVVEDEEEVRRMATRILEKAGFAVVACADGDEALTTASDPESRIDLVLTDVIMPGLTGTKLVERLRELRPGLRALFMSGYNHEVLDPGALEQSAESAFIEKPFSARDLVRTAIALIESQGPPA